MTIKRTINGVEMEFELTERELYDAFFEKQHYFDVEDVKCGCEETGHELDEDQIDEAAHLARKWMDNNDVISDCRWNCIDEAIEEVS